MSAPEPGSNLTDLLSYQEDGIVSRILLKKQAGNVTLFAFDKGQELSEHSAPFDALVQILEGCAEVTVGDQQHALDAGQVVILPANVPHAVSAPERFKMLLTMIRST